MLILSLDVAGNPSKWIPIEKAAYYKAKGRVSWEIGDSSKVLRGGTSATTGLQSKLDIKPIIAISGSKFHVKDFSDPQFNRIQLIRRDKCICAYCGQQFKENELTLEHILPESRGGPTSWMNLVAACGPCNFRKNCRTPEEAKMPLLYLPYVPNRWEAFILGNRNILSDQMEFLLKGVSSQSRQLT